MNITTDYAIRTVLYLASCNKVTSAAEISSAMAIPLNYITVLTKHLRDGGIIQTMHGNGGGYCLAREPKDIKLDEIIRLMESSVCINRCLEDDHYCSRGATDTCPVRRYYIKLQSLLTEWLSAVTVDDLMQQS